MLCRFKEFSISKSASRSSHDGLDRRVCTTFRGYRLEKIIQQRTSCDNTVTISAKASKNPAGNRISWNEPNSVEIVASPTFSMAWCPNRVLEATTMVYFTISTMRFWSSANLTSWSQAEDCKSLIEPSSVLARVNNICRICALESGGLFH